MKISIAEVYLVGISRLQLIMALKICGFIVEVVVAPPALYLKQVVTDVTKNVAVSAQNCYKASKGAFTGEIR